jgi:hypothetical protein
MARQRNPAAAHHATLRGARLLPPEERRKRAFN